MSPAILVAKGTQDLFHRTHMSNRHGLIADVTVTGKTVTLQAEPTRAGAKYSTLARPPRVRQLE